MGITTACGAEMLTIDQSKARIELDPYLEFADAGDNGTQPIEQLVGAGTALQWRPFQSKARNPVRERSLLLRLKIFNPTDTEEWLFNTDDPLVDVTEVALVHAGQVLAHHRGGDLVPFSEWPIPHRHPVFPLHLEAGKHYELWIQVRSGGPTRAQFSLWEPAPFWRSAQQDVFLMGLFFGLLATIATYYVFLFTWLRERRFLYFFGFCLFTALTMAGLHGYSYQFLWPNAPAWQNRAPLVFTSLLILCACFFVIDYLGLTKDNRIRKLLLGAGGSAALYAILQWWIDYTWAGYALLCLLLVGLLLVSYASIRRIRQHGLSGWYFAAGWLAFGISAFLLVLDEIGYSPGSVIAGYTVHIGVAILILLLSFGLAARMRDERNLALRAQAASLHHQAQATREQERALRIERDAKQHLEQRIVERTRDLQRAMNELSDANAQLREISTIDGLTGVKNRRHFDERLVTDLKQARREGTSLALLLIDLDHFKTVNDLYGHLAGVESLKRLTRVLTATASRPLDTVARYGGEEFVVLLPNTQPSGAVSIAERIRTAVQDGPIDWNGQSIRLSVSVGVALSTQVPTADSDQLIEYADKALYEAKAAGRNRVACASPQSD